MEKINNGYLFREFPPITASGNSSFARYTFQHRLPAIIDKLSDQFEKDGPIAKDVESIKHIIADGSMGDGLFSSGPDLVFWNNCALSYRGKTWFDIPFYTAEALFYRLVLDKCQYFSTGIDPFLRQKQNDLSQNLFQCSRIISSLTGTSNQQIIRQLLMMSLWGNRSDLSQLALNRDDHTQEAQETTLIDHSEMVVDLFCSRFSRLDIILDNAGLELFTDLLLAKKSIELGFVGQTFLHTKAYPTFVSDATNDDVKLLLRFLRQSQDLHLVNFAREVEGMISEKQIVVKDHPFWNSPFHFFEMHHALYQNLKASDFMIYKGDANYRRIFGDRILPADVKPESLLDYLPANGLAIRTLKSEIVVGINQSLKDKLASDDPDWMVNGKYGLLQILA